MAWRKTTILEPQGLEFPNAVWVAIDVIQIGTAQEPYGMVTCAAFADTLTAQKYLLHMLGQPGGKWVQPLAIRSFTLNGDLYRQFAAQNQSAGTNFEVFSKLGRDVVLAINDVAVIGHETKQVTYKNFFEGCEEFALQ